VSPRLLPGVLIASTLVAVVLLSLPTAPTEPPLVAPISPTGVQPRPTAQGAEAVSLHRDLFRYGAAPVTATPVEAAPTREVTAAPTTAPTAVPVKLVGVLKKGGTVRAALSIEGEVFVAAAGETVAGYAVVSIDADEGVVVRGSDGQEIRLRVEGR
jgi:hypothetical protein